MEVNNRIRQYNNNLVKYYELNLKDIEPITLKTYKLFCDNNDKYFLKETSKNLINKYNYLENMNVSNVLYPILNKENEYVSNNNNSFFYVTDYINSIDVRSDVKVHSLFFELNKLHKNTSIRKNLDPSKVRPKLDEITNQLDYKFKILENYIRKLESKPLNMFSMPILENYHYILNTKKELVKLQKRIISSVKAKESVEYNFIHNNPSIDHILNIRGENYLISLDKSKIGIDSLDFAKYYINNNYIDIDYKNLIMNVYENNELFNYDYFRFLILYIYIKKINISQEEYVNAHLFENTAININKYFYNFSDNDKHTS